MSSYSQIIRKKDLSIWQKMYIPEIVKGLRMTIRQMFRPTFTSQFPEERFKPDSSFRGRPVLVAENGVERCVACGLCARVCPSLAIEVQAAETEIEKERYPIKFEINMVRCIFCGFCEEACPTYAIQLIPDFEMAEYDRQNMVYEKEHLLISGEGKYKGYNFYKNAGVDMGVKRKGEGDNEEKPVDVTDLLP